MTTLPSDWKSKDFRDVVPTKAVKPLLSLCEQLAWESKEDFKYPYMPSIASRAKDCLAKYQDEFQQKGVLLDFFAYWLEHALEEGLMGRIIAELKTLK